MEKSAFSSEHPPLPPDGPIERNPARAEEAPFEYSLLKGHYQPDGKTWQSGEKLRMEYLELTDGLIKTMTTPMEVMDYDTNEVELRPPSVVIFLDKSGRPLSHLVRNLWPKFAKDINTGKTPAMPQFKFLNIDREQWVHKLDNEGSGILDAKHIDESVIRGLRSVFISPSNKENVRKEGLVEAIDEMPTTLDNEAVLLVDETRSTGRTLQIARGMLQRAFPKTTFKGAHWMNETFTNRGRTLNAVPVWYKSEDKWGRGVNDRYADFTNGEDLDRTAPENYYRTMGRWFLSAPHWFAYPYREQTRDEDYHQLIREFKELATNPDVPVMPAVSRYTSDEAYDDYIVAYNFDEDVSALSQKQKEAMSQDVINQKMAIVNEAKRHNRN